jgi:ubiquinone/menaquinone biosynthesis C-methylase UbiE
MNTRDLKKVLQFYERTAGEYDKDYEIPYWKLYHEITWQNLKQFFPKTRNAAILDAGGGTGYWSIRLAEQGYRVVVTDITENMLKVAREKVKAAGLEAKIETRKVDIRHMSCFESDSFDMALAEGDPVSYCLDPEGAVRELARVVKPKAYVVVSVDSKYSLISSLISRKSFGKLSRLLRTSLLKADASGGAFDFQAFTPEELKTLFEKCGLEVVRIIGKPILSQYIPREKRDEIISANFARILRLESEFCGVSSIVGLGGHLEIVGTKKHA